MITGVILDMDGTMFDTERLSTKVWLMAGEKLGIPVTEALIDKCRGKNPATIREIFKDAFGEDFDYDGARSVKHQFFDEIVVREGVPVKPGLFLLLEYLKKEGIPAAVATSTSRERAEETLKRAGVYDYLSAYVYGDSLSASKPQPDIFWMAAEKLGKKPENCLVIEDSIPGLQAGKAAGGYVIFVPDIVEVPADVKEGITAEMEDLGQVIGWIKRENKEGYHV